MKRTSSLTILLAAVILFLSGCGQPRTYEVMLFGDETVNQGDPVFLEGEPVAVIEEIFVRTDGTPVARIQLNDSGDKKRILRGIERERHRNEIRLVIPNSEAKNDPLAPGGRISIRNNPLPPEFWPPTANTLILAGILLALIVVAFFIVKSLFSMILAVVTLGGSAALAVFTYPFILPQTVTALNFLADKAREAGLESDAVTESSGGGTLNAFFQKIAENLGHFVEGTNFDPRFVAIGVLFVVYFILLSGLFGWARRRLGTKG